MSTESAIVIGGGPAAYTAAIYLARGGRAPLVIEGWAAGGQLLTTTSVDNFPGFPDGIQGPELAMNARAQAERFGARFVGKDVTAVDFSTRPFRVMVGNEVHLAHSVVVATGATAKTLGLPSELELQHRGVAYCSVCDGPLFAGRRLLVIGGGDAAMEETLGLAHLATEVVVVHRRRDWRAAKVMVERAASRENVSFLQPYVVDEVLAGESGTVEAVRLRHVETGETHEEPAGGMFVAIGHHPNTELFADWLERDELGYISVVPGSTRTSVDGVFAAGDVQDPHFRQAITAAASGCVAAIEAERWLAALPDAPEASYHVPAELPRAA